ncbi:MAG: TonB-dependent receptor [Pseudomonadota bacterium]
MRVPIRYLFIFCLISAPLFASDLDEIVVTAERKPSPRLLQIGNTARADASEIATTGHTHIHELMLKLPGTWISRGSGQEHLTAIRSPVLTGAGSCGAFLVLEDGIPTRPGGFCNVNQLFELPTEFSDAIEVVRGPGNALYGSNALHGTINVLMPAINDDARRVEVELGANDYRRLTLGAASSERWRVDVSLTDDGGFRDDTGFQQAKVNARWQGEFAGGSLIAALSLSDLDQETAGFIQGFEAYLDPDLNRSNPNPEAFREASSQRLYAIWQRDIGERRIDVRPFVRHSDMRFLQHFLPGQPLEENGHVSAGVNTLIASENAGWRWQAGLDVEWSDVFLLETQDGPTAGSAFLQETRPQGLHYDYDVRSWLLAPYLQTTLELGDRWAIEAGVRAEFADYRYDNQALDGNSRDDGTACGFGGCLYTRPADRSDDFFNVAPKLGLRYAASDEWTVFGSLRRGFRAPQMTELYRLQSGQLVSDLESEQLDALELGARYVTADVFIEVSAYTMRKRDSVLRDSEGFNISAGKSRHEGVDIEARLPLAGDWQLALNGSYGRHSYDFDLVAARGETFVSGRDVDTAPRTLGRVSLLYRPTGRVSVDIDWNTLGDYYLDAQNEHRYPGHDLTNVTARIELAARWQLTARIRNLTDETIADRADFAFGNYRYFPGRGREVFVSLRFANGS